jgi:hypothetical protein
MSEPPAAIAGTPLADGLSASMASSDATDFSSARRRRHVRRGNDAAGLAFMGLAIGTIGTIVAEQRRRDYYENCYGCGYGYAPGYYYRAPSPYYGRHYYQHYPY